MKYSDPNRVIFREIQEFRQPYVWVIMIAVLAVTVATCGWAAVMVLKTPAPSGAGRSQGVALLALAAGVLVMGGTAYLLYAMKLITEVREDGLYIRFYPLHFSFKRIPLEKVRRFTVVTYRPILEYGGWGIRYGWHGNAYNVSGNRGVKLELIKGRHLLVGSRKPEELAHALEGIMPESHRGL
ncbi:MAG: hypothetical protein HY913_08325 [Desulfomonile tiedjei]|nr:hypothetical protein [Desulfomonile tiedjei]